jgi:hypothetical protein
VLAKALVEAIQLAPKLLVALRSLLKRQAMSGIPCQMHVETLVFASRQFAGIGQFTFNAVHHLLSPQLLRDWLERLSDLGTF